MCVRTEGRWKPSFPHAGSGFRKPRAIMELLCSKGEQEGGRIRKNFILVIFFPPGHGTFKSYHCFTAHQATRRPSRQPWTCCCPSVCGCRSQAALGGCVGQCSAKLYSEGGCGLEQHRLTPAVGNILLSGTWLWHPDLPTFHNPQMEKWHLK